MTPSDEQIAALLNRHLNDTEKRILVTLLDAARHRMLDGSSVKWGLQMDWQAVNEFIGSIK